jgi:hypothetical protein
MSVLNQFMESSIAITEQIALTMQENERLKKRVAELEEPEPEPIPEPHICDLMPIGETFCGLKVVEHNKSRLDGFNVAFAFENGPIRWVFSEVSKAIYESEMELRELRRMKPVVEAAIKNVELIEKSFGRSTEHLFGDEVNNLIKTVREYADNE